MIYCNLHGFSLQQEYFLYTVKNPLEETDKAYTFKGQIKSGSFGLINPSLTWGQRITQRTCYTLNSNYLQADGNYPFKLINGKYTTNEKKKKF